MVCGALLVIAFFAFFADSKDEPYIDKKDPEAICYPKCMKKGGLFGYYVRTKPKAIVCHCHDSIKAKK